VSELIIAMQLITVLSM